MYDATMNIREAEIPAAVAIGQFLVVQAEQMENGGLQVMHVDGVFHHVHAVVIGMPITESCLYASSGQPVGKAIGVMIAPVIGTRQFALAIEKLDFLTSW